MSSNKKVHAWSDSEFLIRISEFWICVLLSFLVLLLTLGTCSPLALEENSRLEIAWVEHSKGILFDFYVELLLTSYNVGNYL